MKRNRNPVAMNLPTTVALLIVFGRHVVQKMTGNPWFASLAAMLVAFSAHLDALEKSEATAKGKGKGAASARNDDLKVVLDDLNGIQAAVQDTANRNAAQADTIIESAGLSSKKRGRYQKPPLSARMAAVPGLVTVRAKAVKRGAAYEWQYSMDGGSTWVPMGTTTVASTVLQGVKVGVTYEFRFRTTRNAATSEWSQTVSLYVH